MLVLERKPQEAIDIFAADGRRIGSITVTSIETGRAALGFDFDAAYTIKRRELSGQAWRRSA